jgi:hypothetical protein
VCRDRLDDPNNCGACGSNCNDDQYCNGSGTCVCRPGTTACTSTGGFTACRNLATDPRACGSCATQCPLSAPVCKAGACVALTTSCGTGTTRCTVGTGLGDRYACVNTQSDPLNCGGCNSRCNQDEVCVRGNCELFRPAVGCSTCPCPSTCSVLGSDTACCPAMGTQKTPICVTGGVCP